MRLLLGDRPRVLFLVGAPTLIAIAMDLCLRARSLARLDWMETGSYVGSAFAGAGISGCILWLLAPVFLMIEGPPSRRRTLARVGLGAFFALVFLPFAFFAYGGQAFYFRVFSQYMSRDTVRLGLRLKGTVLDWLASWGAGTFVMALAALVVAAIVFFAMRRAAPHFKGSRPIIPVLGLGFSIWALWTDNIESRGLQAAPPDACFLHGTVFAFKRAVVTPKGPPKGVTLRTPDPLPAITPAAHRPNVIVVLSESLRADALCSERAPNCDAPFLDREAPDRIALGKLATQSSGTFSSCMMLWTGLPPDVDITTAHRTAMLWEVARAAGYKTAYIASQNLRYQDLGVYLQNAGMDLRLGAADLGDASDAHIGAPDENATARALQFVNESSSAEPKPDAKPFFVLVHLSNTHWPYRVDPGLQPFEPHDDRPLAGADKLHNHYRNSVRMQERTVSAFLRDLRATPSWPDTALVFLSDHGEQFREHGRLYHINNLFEEETRIPGFLVAGDQALSDAQRAALRTFSGQRTYSQDVNATILDLFGVFDQRPGFPFANLLTGRSMLRPRPAVEPVVIVSTESGVWEDDDPVYGARRGDLLAVGTQIQSFECFDSRSDPMQKKPVPARRCAPIIEVAKQHFPQVPAR